MKGIDTNVLLRFVLSDDPEQAIGARAYLLENCSNDDPGYVNRVVLCEVVWVLESVYDNSREDVAALIEGLLRASELMVEDAEAAWSALRAYRDGADFADAMIALTNARVGCDATATFDRAASRRISGLEYVEYKGPRQRET